MNYQIDSQNTMNNPHEMAEELCENFSILGKEIYSCKKCALITVNEILKQHDSLFDKGLKNVYQTMNTPFEMYNDVMNPQKKYWLEVKNEIEKL